TALEVPDGVHFEDRRARGLGAGASRAGLFPHLVSRTPCLSQSDQAFQAAALKPAVDHGALLLPAMNLCTARATSGLPHEPLVSDMMRHFGAPGREQRPVIFDASGPSPASEACFVGVCARANRSARESGYSQARSNGAFGRR